ncbi:hypothetical protein TNCV_3050651 [Trichonephila clavipes]|nr:hypothetical protein TNCV_3050651 [Trichonephila clavipes]
MWLWCVKHCYGNSIGRFSSIRLTALTSHRVNIISSIHSKKTVKERGFPDYNMVQDAVDNWFHNLPQSFFIQGIHHVWTTGTLVSTSKNSSKTTNSNQSEIKLNIRAQKQPLRELRDRCLNTSYNLFPTSSKDLQHLRQGGLM